MDFGKGLRVECRFPQKKIQQISKPEAKKILKRDRFIFFYFYVETPTLLLYILANKMLIIKE
jgi:hypothetical protein